MTSDAYIGSVQSTVRTVDGAGVLSPAVMEQIVRAVLESVEERMDRRRRIDSERRVTPGVAYELDQEGG
ncbi:MAG: hypothetical protein JW929_09740 [Anaerolineales bacterium]|nr:hypothetical protein [Anaerolineales bacterium]